MINWKLNGSSDSLQEPYELIDNDGYIELKLTNVTAATLTTLGFYLKAASSVGDYSILSPEEMVQYVLDEGDEGRGITINQDGNETIFNNTIGNSSSNKIPLIVGSGLSSDEIESNAYVIIAIKINLDVTAAQYIYYDIVLE